MVISGSLPPGLNLQITSGGFGVVRVIALNGTPTAPGTYTFTFQYGRTFQVTITAAGSGAPVVDSVGPSSGGGLAQTFAVTVSDAAGVSAISQVYVIINATLNGAPACYGTYLRSGNTLWLMNNEGSAWQGPSVAGSGSSLSNSQCSLNTAAATVAASGNQLTINLLLTF